MSPRFLPALLLALSLFPLTQAHAGLPPEPTPAPPSTDDPQMWVQRMNRALMTQNYEGTFFHLRGGRVETLTIIHRVEDGKVSERLISHDRNGREVIRANGEQLCFMPDKRIVRAQPVENPQSGLVGTPTFCRNIDVNYKLEVTDSERVNGRMTRVIAVNPRDSYRFGYKLWLDEQTALPLKTQLLDADHNVIEQILFARLTISDRLPKSAVQPGINSEGFKWVRAAPEADAARDGAKFQSPWRAAELPPGFKSIFAHSHPMANRKVAATHIVYSDGLASVSVFVERSDQDEKPMKGPSRMGSSYAFSTVTDGHLVTAVGEVPLQTVRLIAESIKAETRSADR